MNISPAEAIDSLRKSGNVFTELFQHGSLSVEIYAPDKVDHQKPHDRDELYVVLSGNGIFYNDGNRRAFEPGTFLFVPAGIEHRFENFSEDFVTWVFFYGPKGGEAKH